MIAVAVHALLPYNIPHSGGIVWIELRAAGEFMRSLVVP